MGGGGEADDPIQPVRNFSLLPGNINLIIGHPFQLPLHLSSSSTFNIDIARSTRGRGKKKKEREIAVFLQRSSPTVTFHYFRCRFAGNSSVGRESHSWNELIHATRVPWNWRAS